MTTTHIAELALFLSALTAIFSGTTWYLTLFDRTAPLILKAKPGEWTRKQLNVVTTTLVVFNPSSRANCIQNYTFRVRGPDGSFRDCETESLQISENRLPGTLGDPLEKSQTEFVNELMRNLRSRGVLNEDQTYETSEKVISVNPLPLSIPSASGVEVQVGTVDIKLTSKKDKLDIEIELLDIYGRVYTVNLSV